MGYEHYGHFVHPEAFENGPGQAAEGFRDYIGAGDASFLQFYYIADTPRSAAPSVAVGMNGKVTVLDDIIKGL